MFKKLKSKLLTKLFIEWVNDEWDLELLSATRALIEARENTVNGMIELAVGKTEVKGFSIELDNNESGKHTEAGDLDKVYNG